MSGTCLISRGGKGILLGTEDSIITDVLTTFENHVNRSDYASALQTWEGAKGKVDDFLYWYNLGVVELKLDHLPRARLALEKAALSTLYSSEVSQQLDLVQTRLSSTQDAGDTWEDMLNAGMVGLGPLKLWLLALLLVLPFVAMIRISASRRFLAVCGVLSAFPLALVTWFQFSTVAFVVQTPQPVYDGPSDVFETGRQLVPGHKFLARQRGDWCFIVYPSSAQGWVKWGPQLAAGELWGP